VLVETLNPAESINQKFSYFDTWRTPRCA